MSETFEKNSLEAMTARAESLQTPLSQLVDLGQYVHRSIRPSAPQLLDAPSDATSWYTASMNTFNGLPISDNLTLKFGEFESITIEKYNGEDKTQPVWRFEHWLPHDETRVQRTRIQVFREDSGATFPLDIETSLFREIGRFHDSFLGYGYEEQEPHIDKMLDRMLSLVAPE